MPLALSESALGVEIGSVIAGKYRVERVIGRGGMGVVVAASQPELARTVAIKLIRSDSIDDRSAIARLLREAKAAASIQSEHVARVLDVGTLDTGGPFIVMEYLDGSDLQTQLDREGPMRPADAVDFLLQACEAIAEAHRNGIVHRDLKPANLFVARLPGGRACVKVVDFGISKTIGRDTGEPLTQPASVVGSLYHMAPEQMRGAAVDARTDVWALGLLLYEMLTGRKPFGNQSWPAVAAQVLSDAGPLLAASMDGVSEDLQAVIHKCLTRSPQQRYGTVAELAVALSRFGSRRAHLSLERIVLLATSTGSLSALALEPTEPARDSLPPLAETRPVPAGGFETVLPARSTGETPLRGTPATPFPVSAAPRPSAAPPRSRLALGVVGALALVAPLTFWVWRGTRGSVSESERRAPLSPMAAPAGDPAGFERGERKELPRAESPSGVVVEVLPSSGRAEAAAGLETGPAAQSVAASGAGAAGSAAATHSAAGPAQHSGSPGSEARQSAVSESVSRPSAAPSTSAPSTVAPTQRAPTPGQPVEREPEAPSPDEAREAAAPLEPNPPRAPGKAPAKASSPWDLNDIEFGDEGKR